jgi:hypothetical protein
MDEVWESRLFDSMAELIDEVNARGLTADRFKVVPELSAAGRGHYHLLSLGGAAPDPLLAAVAVTADGEIEPLVEEERHEAVDEAEAIIHDAQHDRG